MDIIPLSHETLEECIDLVIRSFPEDTPTEIRSALTSSLEREDQDLKDWLHSKGCTTVTYWIAMERTTVIGITGLYARIEDEKDEAYWLGWFCVDPAHRGRGAGSLLLDYSIEEAKGAGKHFLRLYTTSSPNEAAAQKLYDKKGFVTFCEKDDPDSEYKIIDKELRLV